MTLEQLRMLTKIAEEGSIFAAAEALHKTQPTVSVSMKKLEKELGLQLLSRDQYRAALTDEGKILYEKAKTILQHVGNWEEVAEHLSVGNEPQMRIAIEGSCPVPLMIQIMGICNERYPKTEFSFSMENISGAVERLVLDEADLAITPIFDTGIALESFPLAYSAWMVRVASANFPLCSKDGAVHFDQLKEYVQVIIRDSSRKPRDEKFSVLDGGRHWYVNDYYTKKELILAGMGWGMLHRHFVDAELEDGRLWTLEVENHPLTVAFDIHVIRKADQAHGPIASALWADLEKLVE